MKHARAFPLAPAGLALALAWAFPFAAAGEEAPIRFRHVLQTGRGPVPVSMELYLEAVNDDVIALKVAGDLAPLQEALPGLLSKVVEDTCTRRIGVEVQSVRAEVDSLRLLGRVQIITYRCPDPSDLGSRQRRLGNITAFDALVGGRIEDNCLGGEVAELSLDPKGLVGGILNLLGLSERIARRARETINETLGNEMKCIELPEKLRILHTNLSSGGFRDFGDGKMGFVVKGSINVRAGNLVSLVKVLAEEGELRD
ncbi:hypothetical protein [Amaricoccus solimangrovi]|uniref:DUF4403 family protein n=1 Tax=Amaricoccus solimangrovi TaxID=2589815 RepID=A0A501WUR1_9RHOB|nr:hypothetical protein [Amaricoccus solimangrovi]TPE52472.1 hypothetical protein FJM51_04645 [Amaricoccus solimangrovi]